MRWFSLFWKQTLLRFLRVSLLSHRDSGVWSAACSRAPQQQTQAEGLCLGLSSWLPFLWVPHKSWDRFTLWLPVLSSFLQGWVPAVLLLWPCIICNSWAQTALAKGLWISWIGHSSRNTVLMSWNKVIPGWDVLQENYFHSLPVDTHKFRQLFAAELWRWLLSTTHCFPQHMQKELNRLAFPSTFVFK